MPKEIVNRVANSKLVTIDLEDFYPIGNRSIIDISQWLFQGIILKEKDFRGSIEKHDWAKYQDSFIALTCATEAIVPSWAYLLITTKLSPFAKRIVVGDIDLLETVLFKEIIDNLAIDNYINKPIIIKGCSSKKIPQTVYVQLIERLLPIAKSILYGEACSSVPLYKREKYATKK